jgi:hypothetical protein
MQTLDTIINIAVKLLGGIVLIGLLLVAVNEMAWWLYKEAKGWRRIVAALQAYDASNNKAKERAQS